jgi:RNase P subunit RPR2
MNYPCRWCGHIHRLPRTAIEPTDVVNGFRTVHVLACGDCDRLLMITDNQAGRTKK